MTSIEEIERAAAVWLVREDRGLDATETEQLDLWLEEDIARRVTYLRLKDIWSYADRLAALGPSVPFSQSTVQPWFKTWRGGVAAAIIVLLVGFGAGYLLYDNAPTQLVVTSIDQQRTLRLKDGTRIQLNTNTRLQTRVTSAVRTVMLDDGEAYFDVVHDAQHPFVVIAGARRITDLGTKFSVSREGDKVEVVVKEGRVRVDAVASSVPAVYAGSNSVVIANAAETLVAPRPAQEISDKLDWRFGVLTFHQDTLSDVAAVFNRYNRRKIEIEGSARAIRIGGSFHADNIDGLTDLLRQGFNLNVKDTGEVVVISQK